VFARCVSALKDERVRASKVLPISAKKASDLIKDKQVFLEQVRRGKLFTRILIKTKVDFFGLQG
jgi:6-phosphogluconate dehydrogenase